MMPPMIAVIGAGNMGSSLIGGLIGNSHPPQKIVASDQDLSKLAELRKLFQIETTTDNLKAAEIADVILLAIKPQIFAEVTQLISPIVQTRQPLFISIAAGIRISSIQEWLGEKAAIVRCMPNTPALIGFGATAMYANDKLSTQQRDLAEAILQAVGIVVWLPKEELMDAVTALSGSGPAYYFQMMEALQIAGEKMGLPTETARLLTLQTALGAVQMAINSEKSLPELRKLVTSPGGTTEKALSVLEEHHLQDIYHKALVAAKLRSEELAKIAERK